MKEWLKQLFSEESQVSMGRVLSAILVVSGIILAFVSIWTAKNLDNLVYALVAAGITGKVAQKFSETK